MPHNGKRRGAGINPGFLPFVKTGMNTEICQPNINSCYQLEKEGEMPFTLDGLRDKLAEWARSGTVSSGTPVVIDRRNHSTHALLANTYIFS